MKRKRKPEHFIQNDLSVLAGPVSGQKKKNKKTKLGMTKGRGSFYFSISLFLKIKFH